MKRARSIVTVLAWLLVVPMVVILPAALFVLPMASLFDEHKRDDYTWEEQAQIAELLQLELPPGEKILTIYYPYNGWLQVCLADRTRLFSANEEDYAATPGLAELIDTLICPNPPKPFWQEIVLNPFLLGWVLLEGACVLFLIVTRKKERGA